MYRGGEKKKEKSVDWICFVKSQHRKKKKSEHSIYARTSDSEMFERNEATQFESAETRVIFWDTNGSKAI